MIVAGHEYLFSASHTADGPVLSSFQPKGQENLAQGSPWVRRNIRFAPKGLAMRTRPLRRFGADSRRTWWPLQG